MFHLTLEEKEEGDLRNFVVYKGRLWMERGFEYEFGQGIGVRFVGNVITAWFYKIKAIYFIVKFD